MTGRLGSLFHGATQRPLKVVWHYFQHLMPPPTPPKVQPGDSPVQLRSVQWGRVVMAVLPLLSQLKLLAVYISSK